MKKNLSILYKILIFILSYSFTLEAQNKVSISGQIKEAKTGIPVPFANVFFNGTQKGIITDAEGFFKIENIEPGYYELTISQVNYKVYSENIDLSNGSSIENKILRITPKSEELQAVEVSAKEQRQREKWLKEFENYFIGQSKFAKSCYLRNPEVLTFKGVEDGFVASANEMLEIENLALGYKILFALETFYFYQNQYAYLGKAQFIPLSPTDVKQAKKWKKNRQAAYKGSERHFLWALINNKLKEEDFEISQTNDSPFNGQSIDINTNYLADNNSNSTNQRINAQGTQNMRINPISRENY